MKAVVRNELSGEEHTVEANKLIKVDESIETFRYFDKSFWKVGDVAFMQWADQKKLTHRGRFEAVIIYKIENQLANVRSFWQRGNDEDLNVTREGVEEGKLHAIKSEYLDFDGELVEYRRRVENGEFPELWSFDNNPEHSRLAQFTSMDRVKSKLKEIERPKRFDKFDQQAREIMAAKFAAMSREQQDVKVKEFNSPSTDIESLTDKVVFRTFRDDDTISKRTRMYAVLYQIEKTGAQDIIKKTETGAELTEIQQKRLRDAKGLVKQYEMLKHDVQAGFIEQAKANLGDRATPQQIEAERKKLWFTEPLAEKVPQFPGITAAKSGSTMMYVGVGFAAVAVVGFFLFKK